MVPLVTPDGLYIAVNDPTKFHPIDDLIRLIVIRSLNLLIITTGQSFMKVAHEGMPTLKRIFL